MPDHWDTKPEDLFNVPDRQSAPAPNGHHDQPNEIKLRDPRGRLRLPEGDQHQRQCRIAGLRHQPLL